jgi:hypothetical protein
MERHASDLTMWVIISIWSIYIRIQLTDLLVGISMSTTSETRISFPYDIYIRLVYSPSLLFLYSPYLRTTSFAPFSISRCRLRNLTIPPINTSPLKMSLRVPPTFLVVYRPSTQTLLPSQCSWIPLDVRPMSTFPSLPMRRRRATA